MRLYARVVSLVKPYWVAFSIGILGTVFASTTDAAIAWLVKPLVDKGLIAREASFLKWLPVLIVIIFIARGFSNFLANYFITRVGRSVVMDMRQLVFKKLLSLPLNFFDSNPPGQLISLMIYNIEQMATACSDSLLIIFRQGCLAIGLICVMFFISLKLTLLFIVVGPIVAIVVHMTSKRLKKLSVNVQSSVADITHTTNEAVDGLKVIRTFNGENYEENKFNKIAKLNRHRELKVVVTNALGTSIVQIVIALPIALVVVVINLMHLSVSVGGFSAMLVAVIQLLTPIRRLTKVNSAIQKGIAGAESVFEVLDKPNEVDNGDKLIKRAKGHIEYKNVCFTYPNSEKRILSSINLTVKPGMIVALVGHTGSGKSTLVNLLPRFYDIEHGEILLDGINIKDYQLGDLRKQFAFVSQHITLFNDNIARNIAYAKGDNVDLDAIRNAADAAYILDEINKLPLGFDTMVGENGMMLSGGQRQRLAIARAIFKNASILILDEATSALDTVSERKVQDALNNLMHKCTTLVIAHRLSTVEHADLILVMDDGKIIEQGKHAELLAKDGYYAKLYKMQFSEP
ncbi:MAG: lipid A export permease/ATP-binding protein MsbA [Gammaproteobacteria bacterium]|nr:lipid A export permease/ATP-binding protein MsbA [Gammaproteobacteria bacterium]